MLFFLLLLILVLLAAVAALALLQRADDAEPKPGWVIPGTLDDEAGA